MQNVGNILSQAFCGSLDDLREQYLRLASLDSRERKRAVAEANAELADTREAIAQPETLRARDVLLSYQFVTRFTYDVEPKYKRHFVDLLSGLWREDKSLFEGWNWTCPSESDFCRTICDRLPSIDFYAQANLLCNALYGLSIPSDCDGSLLAWAERVELTEARWTWRYDNQIKEEKARWFSSRKRIDEIEKQRVIHRAKSARCVDEVAPMFRELSAANSRLLDLKGRELGLSVYCAAINRAAEALNQGTQLKHLLLENAHEMDSIYRAATRGL